MTKYRSQQIAKPSTISDLVNYINKSNASSGSDGTMTQNQVHNNFNSGLDALLTSTTESNNLSNLTDNVVMLNNLYSMLDPRNVEGTVKLDQVKQTAQNISQEMVNYTNSINIGYNLLNKFTMPEYFEADFTKEDLSRAGEYINKDYAADDTINQNAYNFLKNNPNFDVNTASIRDGKIIIHGTDADAQKAIYDSDLYTIENIQNAITAIETIEANLYTDPLKRDKEHHFIGKHFHTDKDKNKTQDIQIIKQLGIGKDKDATGGLKNKLLTVLSALEGDKIITNNEIYFILTGDEAGLDAARIENITASENNLKSYRTSINTIERFRKSISEYLVKYNIKASDLSFEEIMQKKILGDWDDLSALNDSIIQVNAMDLDNPMFDGWSNDDIRAYKLNRIENWTVSDLFANWDREMVYYQILKERESKRYKVWANRDFELGSDIENTLIDKKIKDNVLSKYYIK